MMLSAPVLTLIQPDEKKATFQSKPFLTRLAEFTAYTQAIKMLFDQKKIEPKSQLPQFVSRKDDYSKEELDAQITKLRSFFSPEEVKITIQEDKIDTRSGKHTILIEPLSRNIQTWLYCAFSYSASMSVLNTTISARMQEFKEDLALHEKSDERLRFKLDLKDGRLDLTTPPTFCAHEADIFVRYINYYFHDIDIRSSATTNSVVINVTRPVSFKDKIVQESFIFDMLVESEPITQKDALQQMRAFLSQYKINMHTVAKENASPVYFFSDELKLSDIHAKTFILNLNQLLKNCMKRDEYDIILKKVGSNQFVIIGRLQNSEIEKALEWPSSPDSDHSKWLALEDNLQYTKDQFANQRKNYLDLHESKDIYVRDYSSNSSGKIFSKTVAFPTKFKQISQTEIEKNLEYLMKHLAYLYKQQLLQPASFLPKDGSIERLIKQIEIDLSFLSFHYEQKQQALSFHAKIKKLGTFLKAVNRDLFTIQDEKESDIEKIDFICDEQHFDNLFMWLRFHLRPDEMNIFIEYIDDKHIKLTLSPTEAYQSFKSLAQLRKQLKKEKKPALTGKTKKSLDKEKTSASEEKVKAPPSQEQEILDFKHTLFQRHQLAFRKQGAGDFVSHPVFEYKMASQIRDDMQKYLADMVKTRGEQDATSDGIAQISAQLHSITVEHQDEKSLAYVTIKTPDTKKFDVLHLPKLTILDDLAARCNLLFKRFESWRFKINWSPRLTDILQFNFIAEPYDSLKEAEETINHLSDYFKTTEINFHIQSGNKNQYSIILQPSHEARVALIKAFKLENHLYNTLFVFENNDKDDLQSVKKFSKENAMQLINFSKNFFDEELILSPIVPGKTSPVEDMAYNLIIKKNLTEGSLYKKVKSFFPPLSFARMILTENIQKLGLEFEPIENQDEKKREYKASYISTSEFDKESFDFYAQFIKSNLAEYKPTVSSQKTNGKYKILIESSNKNLTRLLMKFINPHTLSKKSLAERIDLLLNCYMSGDNYLRLAGYFSDEFVSKENAYFDILLYKEYIKKYIPEFKPEIIPARSSGNTYCLRMKPPQEHFNLALNLHFTPLGQGSGRDRMHNSATHLKRMGLEMKMSVDDHNGWFGSVFMVSSPLPNKKIARICQQDFYSSLNQVRDKSTVTIAVKKEGLNQYVIVGINDCSNVTNSDMPSYNFSTEFKHNFKFYKELNKEEIMFCFPMRLDKLNEYYQSLLLSKPGNKPTSTSLWWTWAGFFSTTSAVLDSDSENFALKLIDLLSASVKIIKTSATTDEIKQFFETVEKCLLEIPGFYAKSEIDRIRSLRNKIVAEELYFNRDDKALVSAKTYSRDDAQDIYKLLLSDLKPSEFKIEFLGLDDDRDILAENIKIKITPLGKMSNNAEFFSLFIDRPENLKTRIAGLNHDLKELSFQKDMREGGFMINKKLSADEADAYMDLIQKHIFPHEASIIKIPCFSDDTLRRVKIIPKSEYDAQFNIAWPPQAAQPVEVSTPPLKLSK